MFTQTTKKHLKLISISVVILSIALSGKAFAGEKAEMVNTTVSNVQFQTLINWNEKAQATLSTKMEQKLKLEMQALINSSETAQTTLTAKMENNLNLKTQALVYSQPEKAVYTNQLTNSTTRDVVLIKADNNGDGFTALSTTPVVVIIDRKELCLLNL